MKPVEQKIVKVGNSYYVAIPKFLVDQRGYKKGDKIPVLYPEDAVFGNMTRDFGFFLNAAEASA